MGFILFYLMKNLAKLLILIFFLVGCTRQEIPPKEAPLVPSPPQEEEIPLVPSLPQEEAQGLKLELKLDKPAY